MKKRYGGKIRNILREIAREAKCKGYQVSEIYDLSNDEYRWSIVIKLNAISEHEKSISVRPVAVSVEIWIAESEQYGDGNGGVNFMLEILDDKEGTIIATFAPFNYTPQCWVSRRDKAAVVERWNIFSNAIDADNVLDLIEREYHGRADQDPKPAP